MRLSMVVLALMGATAQAQEAPRNVVPTPVPAIKSDSVALAAPVSVLKFTTQKISVRMPLGWRALPIGGKQPGILASFAPLTATGATLSLSYSDDAGRTKLPENLPSTIATALAQRYPGYKLTAKQHFSVAGADAWRFDGQVTPVGQSMVVRNRQVYICNQGRIYIATLTSKKEDFERLTPSLDQFLKSITWLD